MSKQKTMKFADGEGPITIGQKVAYGNGQGGHHSRFYEEEVTKIGSKFVTVGRNTRFFIETGYMDTNYVGGMLYSSKKAWEDAVSKQAVIDKLNAHMRYYTYRITYEQAIEIGKILNLNLEK